MTHIPVRQVIHHALGHRVLALVAALVGTVPALPDGPDAPKNDPKKDAEAKPANVEMPDGFPLPAGAVRRFGNRQMRHPEGVRSAAVSPDGKLLATASYTSVVVWDLQTLTAKLALPTAAFNNYGQGDRGGQLTFMPDSKSLLFAVRPTAERFGRGAPQADLAQVWDVETGKLKFALKGTYDYGTSAWVTSGGKEIAVLTMNQGLKFYDPKDGKHLRDRPAVQQGDMPWVSAGGDVIAVVPQQGTGLVVHNIQTSKDLFSVPAGRVVQAALSPDGELLVYQDEEKKVHVHDLKAEKERFSFTHPGEKPFGPMRISADKKTLYFGSDVGHLLRWDLKDNKRIAGLDRHSLWTLTTIAISPDESTLYSMGSNKVIHRWDLKTGKRLPLPEGYETIAVMLPAADGKHLFIGDHATQLDRWELTTGKKVQSLSKISSGGINCLAQSTDGRWLACGRVLQDVQIWDLSTGKMSRELTFVAKPDRQGGDQVQRVAFTPDGKTVLGTTPKTGLTAWSMDTGKKLWNVPDTGGQLMAVDPKGKWIAAGGGYNQQKVQWVAIDPATGNIRFRADVDPLPNEAAERRGGYPPYLTDLKPSPDGSRLITAHYDGSVRVWDPVAGKEVVRWQHGRLGAASMDVSPDGKWVAIGEGQRSAFVMELATGKTVFTRTGQHSQVTQVAFTKDGRGLLSNADLAPVLWDLAPSNLPKTDGPADALWQTLGGDDGAKAYALQWAMIKDPKVAVKLFADRVDPTTQAMAREPFDKMVADLDSPRFAAREKAERQLMDAGHRVPTAWLRQVLAAATSDEQRARLGRILAKREKPNADEWRIGRAVQTLELARSDEAKELLRTWAGAAEGSLLNVEATAALTRLGK